MRKKRDIFLDFTSLLDVTLILIFFFVIFSHMEDAENAQKTEDKLAELESALMDAEEREEAAAGLEELLKSELEIVRGEDERGADNLESMLEFAKGGNIKMLLVMDGAKWSIKVSQGDEVLTKITNDEELEARLLQTLKDAGYTSEDTLLCEFIFNGSEAGTASAYRKIQNALTGVKGTFAYLYCSETDLSVGEE